LKFVIIIKNYYILAQASCNSAYQIHYSKLIWASTEKTWLLGSASFTYFK